MVQYKTRKLISKYLLIRYKESSRLSFPDGGGGMIGSVGGIDGEVSADTGAVVSRSNSNNMVL
jgi:hypothetical protein